MIVFYYITFIGYTIAISYVTIYCLVQFHLFYKYLKHVKKGEEEYNVFSEEELKALPMVTIQLPIFNEMYVVERLVDNITKMDYPKDKLEIQILDDSTDETVGISQRKVEEYKAKGFDIVLQHRTDRAGYKAGALKEGMLTAKGDFIAIFDADFLPHSNFLMRTIPHFKNKEIGVVQTRWEHINKNYSILTRLQALQLNVHFTVEQKGREKGNYLLQFNGTAGVWRRETIEDAGGWEADTLTEDLDLSYRAQLKKWRIKYLKDFGSPAELPVDMQSLKTQQHRWMKGGAESAKKLLPGIWRSNLSFAQKVHATVHLSSSSIFLFVFMIGFLSVPLLFAMQELGYDHNPFGVFSAGLMAIFVVYLVSNLGLEPKGYSRVWKGIKLFFMFPLFLAMSMGLSLHNTIAVIQGYRGKKSPFVRTPKFDIVKVTDKFKRGNYLSTKIPFTTVFEGILALYFVSGLYIAYLTNDYSFSFFHIMLIVGYSSIFYYSLKHSR